ncbi:MAG: efflux RND transporter periplasmic adaptor subunit [Candidatus Sumerlaeaceae bacterium]|nr:efflux RND transporter periplasmic adaptor subunit [Candidatus Sumerlaeaceae bacterium]
MSEKSVTNQKLQSLRIDPARKAIPRRRGGWWMLAAGFALGAGVMAAIQTAQPGAGLTKSPNEPAATTQPITQDQASTTTTTAESRAGAIVLTSSGYVTPRQRISLIPQVIAQVMWVGVEKGDRVSSGQVLVRLDDRDYQARCREARARLQAAEARLRELENGSRPEEIARAKAEVDQAEILLANAERLLERRRLLVEQGGAVSRETVDDARAARDNAAARLEVARQNLALVQAGPRQEQLDAARAELAAAKAAVEVAELNLEDTVIRAPRDGTILEKLIEPGELVTPQSFGGSRGARTELLSLADLSDLQVEVDINEADFAKVFMGQPAKVTLDAYPDKSYEGRVREIAPEANRTKATVQIKVQILNPDGLVLPEMSARVDLLQGSPASSPHVSNHQTTTSMN